ncbi:Transcriptional regulatory protein, C terminal [Bacillus sp. OV166]|uniref:winged helix-turn-helix domain-containing protein n=1 Tax=Bacillus sp. OV166 TaxID=1882763 RepID=UPI000A2ADCDC|nr:winged helix-turn-helix domain-containing protein [Bacillus sp. OV166]SMQ81292.1 Transcriptional regulatory protein, C terminal [Bacillus sp. OV166]
MEKITLDDLLDLEDNWLDRDGLDEGGERNLWLEEGIRLYKRFLDLDRKEPRYSIHLADLYLQLGRDEKMRRGNYHTAYDILRKASLYTPSKPDAFYHLSFVLAEESRKWEAVLFYGKEALEKGIEGSKRIKLLCNLALGYSRMGYVQKALELIQEAQKSDGQGEHSWFIQLYKDKMKLKRKEPILLKEIDENRTMITNRDLDQLVEEAEKGQCVVLNLAGPEKLFYGIKDTIRLEPKQANLLGYLIENKGIYCTKSRIENAVWNDQTVNPTTVRRYISAIRKKLSQAMGRNDIDKNILETTGLGEYVWKAEISAKVLRNG